MKKKAIIYISSNGRSGSTILELLLNTFNENFTLGEINSIPWELKEERRVCGCGREPSKCTFWRKLNKQAKKELLKIDGQINKFRESHGSGKVLRFKEIIRILLKKNIPKKDLKKFCDENFNLLNAVNNIIDDKIEYFIDSSKDPYRLFWLNSCTSINIKSIHLVKDPRAFVYSMIRRDDSTSTLKVIRMSIRYILENYLFRFLSNSKDSYFLRYEDMASSPNKIMKEVSNWLKLKYSDGDYKKFRKVENHGLAGNISRIKDDNVYLDEKWKNRFSDFHKKIVKVITYPLGKKYGYF